MSLPSGDELVGFADDVALLEKGSLTAEVEQLTTVAIRAVENWIHSKCLHLAEMVLIINLISPQTSTIAVEPCNIVSKRAIKYLGEMIDDRLSFTSHVDDMCKRAEKTVKRDHDNLTVRSGGLGAGPEKQCNLQRLSSVHRLTNLRFIYGYRTMSSEAACVVVGVMPISVLLEEDVYCYENKDTLKVRDLAIENSMSN
ncbi:uncharacterized protein LOC129752439 [Uranotaenia lowii]|uniref:uncharacterized protein LOC129752439 n=1 Tax=Uranotaenia lowii TaxID=190385 RepID=UPI00247A5863|nr:uncharacterized protein LOC129752439 [Uranotaenia lowii]